MDPCNAYTGELNNATVTLGQTLYSLKPLSVGPLCTLYIGFPRIGKKRTFLDHCQQNVLNPCKNAKENYGPNGMVSTNCVTHLH